MKLRRNIFLFVAAILAATSIARSQESVVLVGDVNNPAEYKSGSTITAYSTHYIDDDGVACLEFDFPTWLVMPALTPNMDRYDFTIDKKSHLGNKNWGMSSICPVGGCIPFPDLFSDDNFKGSDELHGLAPVRYEAPGMQGEGLRGNIWHPIFQVKGDLVYKADEYKYAVKFFRAGKPAEELLTFDIILKALDHTSTDNPGVNTQVRILNTPGGMLSLEYQGLGQNLNLEIFDITGARLYASSMPDSGSFRLPLTLPQGVVIFNITSAGKKVFAEKVLVK